MSSYTLVSLPGRYAVCLLPPTAPVPPWASGGDFCSITRTQDELSIICAEDALPADLPEEIQVARNWVLLRVQGPFTFDVVGVMAALTTALADAGVVLLAVATYQTDYLLVKAEQTEAAMRALSNAGHQVTR
jgi:hypothetical protein